MSGMTPYRPGQVPEPLEVKEPLPDPSEWRPEDNRDWTRENIRVVAEKWRSAPLNYGSLAEKTDDIAGIEATARVELIRAMEQRGLYPDERGIRMFWRLEAEGYGFAFPEGFVHPEAPDDIKRDGIRAWKRCVEMASDSLQKVIHLMVWRRKHPVAPVLPPAPLALGPVTDFEVDVSTQDPNYGDMD